MKAPPPDADDVQVQLKSPIRGPGGGTLMIYAGKYEHNAPVVWIQVQGKWNMIPLGSGQVYRMEIV